MIIRFERPYSHAAHWARRVAFISAIITVAAWAAHRFGPLLTPHFIVLILIGTAFATAGVVLAGIGFASLWNRGARGGKAVFAAILLCLINLAPVDYGAFLFFTHPTLYDVSTDFFEAPSWLTAPQASQYPFDERQPVSAQDRSIQSLYYQELSGRRYDGGLDRVYQAVLQVAKDQRITFVADKGTESLKLEIPVPLASVAKPAAKVKAVTIKSNPPKDEPVDDEGGDLPPVSVVEDAADETPPQPLDPQVEPVVPVPTSRPGAQLVWQGEMRSLVLGLHYDVVIRLREETETTLVDMRVASRHFYHDFGQSAKITDDFLRALDASLLGISGS
jgi:Protein of unknown function (DUF1499)